LQLEGSAKALPSPNGGQNIFWTDVTLYTNKELIEVLKINA
jgi:hypothetical protein